MLVGKTPQFQDAIYSDYLARFTDSTSLVTPIAKNDTVKPIIANAVGLFIT